MLNIKNGILQCPSSMSSFRIQDTRSRPTSGTSMSKRVLAVQGPWHDSGILPASLQHYGQSIHSKLCQRWSSASRRHCLSQPWCFYGESSRTSEKLQFEATCARLWANGIHDQIMDEQEKVQGWISGMTDDINRLPRVQPAWIQHLQDQGNQQPPAPTVPSSSSQPEQASSSAASTVPVRAAPVSRNPSMASAPKHAPFPKTQGADPWADPKSRQQRQ